MYLGNSGCLLNIPFSYLTSKGWSDSFENPLTVTALAKALCAVHKLLYKQPSIYMLFKNYAYAFTSNIGILIQQ